MIRIFPFLLLMACAAADVPRPVSSPEPAVVTGTASGELPPAPPAEAGMPQPVVEAISLLGKPLTRPVASAEVQLQREQALDAAKAEYAQHPTAENLIWVGRRLGYLARYGEAIQIFTEGAEKFPSDARFLRHRGHRYITVREFEKAIADLQKATLLIKGKADEVEPDGEPNARNTPIGSLQSNICYHLGLAYYLKGDFERARPVYQRCVNEASNPDRLVSTSHWLYMTLRRLGRQKDAEAVLEAVNPGLDVIENLTYHKLLLFYRGEIVEEELIREPRSAAEAPGLLYGIGNWHLYNGDPAGAQAIFRRVVAGDAWASFGTIAAEAELARGVR